MFKRFKVPEEKENLTCGVTGSDVYFQNLETPRNIFTQLKTQFSRACKSFPLRTHEALLALCCDIAFGQLTLSSKLV